MSAGNSVPLRRGENGVKYIASGGCVVKYLLVVCDVLMKCSEMLHGSHNVALDESLQCIP